MCRDSRVDTSVGSCAIIRFPASEAQAGWGRRPGVTSGSKRDVLVGMAVTLMHDFQQQCTLKQGSCVTWSETGLQMGRVSTALFLSDVVVKVWKDGRNGGLAADTSASCWT
ncbi:unnamed protein product [Ostreobium quekettii]|uniref:Uncharacterized protein n=1 Tax=Ostreobium quekettii TaxID=121088 RepID=A0A8S1ITP9_9CHLO|nr:unnamed protein product [Ostreobium quekettii]